MLATHTSNLSLTLHNQKAAVRLLIHCTKRIGIRRDTETEVSEDVPQAPLKLVCFVRTYASNVAADNFCTSYVHCTRKKRASENVCDCLLYDVLQRDSGLRVHRRMLRRQ